MYAEQMQEWSDMSVTFLGTCSGGGPSETRNCSSLVCDMLQNKSLWMVDCAEGTTRQIASQPSDLNPPLKLQKISKIFVTHMHADHIMGIVPLLRTLLYPPGLPMGTAPSMSNYFPKVEIYGPAGLRLFVRQIMKMTLTRTADKYVVHELLTPSDSITPCVPRAANADPAEFNIAQNEIMHFSELAGSDLHATTITGDPQAEGVNGGYWYSITTDQGHHSPITVSAGSILHRDPCLGYIFQETSLPARKLVILGDTYDATYISPLCVNPPPSLLIHEATESCISRSADSVGNLSRRSENEVMEKALLRGHSTSEMAGVFAKTVGAEELVLNHIGGRFPAPRHPRDSKRLDIMRDIEKRATAAWGAQDKSAIAAYDFLRVYVPMPNAVALVEKAAQLKYGYAHIATQTVAIEASRGISGYAHAQVYAGHVAGNAPSNDSSNKGLQENPGNAQSDHVHGRSHRGRGRGRSAGSHEHDDADGDAKGRTHTHPYPRPSNKARDIGE